MSVTTRLAWAEVRHRPARFIAVLLAIVIGTAFATATAVFSATAVKTTENLIAAPLQRTDVVIMTSQTAPSAAVTPASIAHLEQTILDTAGVDGAAAVVSAFQEPVTSGTSIRLETAVADPALAWTELKSGSWPSAPDQVVLSPDLAAAEGVSIGDPIVLSDLSGRAETELVVTGISAPKADTPLGGGLPTAWVEPDVAAAASGAFLSYVLVRADGDAAAVAGALQDRLGAGYEVDTRDEAMDRIIAEVSRDAVPFTAVIAMFAVIALAVAAIVVGNTFRIIIEQRRAQIGLERLVGVTAAGVRRQVLVEALLLGAAGTAIGLLLGIGLGYLAASALGADSAGLALPPIGLVLAAGGGLVMTAAAAWLPAERACRVSPMEASRPPENIVAARRSARRRIVAGAVTAVLGTAIMLFGAASHVLLLATVGGLISVAGVLLLAPVIVRGLARLLQPLGRLGGVPGALAARDVTRHLSRASNTVIALLVGVTLITMIHVGAATMSATATRQVADNKEKEQMESIISVLSTVATVLLAVAAAIAVIGVANTLALSVIERRRETALLRILGLQRSQAATMVAVESVILGLIGTVVGLLLGTAYGITAAYTILGRYELVIRLPWAALAAVAAITMVAVLIAAVLPAVRSARVRLLTATA